MWRGVYPAHWLKEEEEVGLRIPLHPPMAATAPEAKARIDMRHGQVTVRAYWAALATKAGAFFTRRRCWRWLEDDETVAGALR